MSQYLGKGKSKLELKEEYKQGSYDNKDGKKGLYI